MRFSFYNIKVAGRQMSGTYILAHKPYKPLFQSQKKISLVQWHKIINTYIITTEQTVTLLSACVYIKVSKLRNFENWAFHFLYMHWSLLIFLSNYSQSPCGEQHIWFYNSFIWSSTYLSTLEFQIYEYCHGNFFCELWISKRDNFSLYTLNCL